MRSARKHKAEKGVLPEIGKKRGKKVSPEIEKRVIDYYFNDEISRLLPGKKDYVSVKPADGGPREHKQKRLLLRNIKELYAG